ncbi:MAG TPA: hypothetical protein VFQ41_20590 [Candidatus Angelobacter sp.]|nr:hypothetical protein [Candidatus Angelobacter sp.]
MKLAFCIFVRLVLAALVSQGHAAQATRPDQASATPSITFDRFWNDFTPQSVTITVFANGAAKYSSRDPGKNGDEADEYHTEFTLSRARCDKLFRYAGEANYFQGDFTFKKHAVASTGKKTLSYADASRHFNTTYDYSENRAIQEITGIFMGVSNTIEHGRKLQFLRRFDKLGLEAELKVMEDAAENHNLVEMQLIAPTLESIADDASILNIARQRAHRLLAKANSE